MTTGKELINRETGEITEVGPEPLSVSPEYVRETTKSLALLQDMTRNLLKRGRDYGRTPGTASDGLWDPGASLVIAGFNCYAGQRRIVSLIDQEDKISIIVEVPVISRQSGREVGSGIGAASTLEVKYKYRWFYSSELKEMGFNDEQIATLKTSKKHPGKYQIENIERGELLNTLVKQASKRAECDAALALPGVASVLREMFDPRKQEGAAEQKGRGEYEGPAWQRYWGEVNRMGYTEQESYAKLGVTSMKTWLVNGHSLDEALDILRGRRQPPPGGAPEGGGDFTLGEDALGEATLSAEAVASSEREMDMKMLRSSASKLKWDQKRLSQEVKNRVGIADLSKLTDEQLHDIASKITDLAELA